MIFPEGEIYRARRAAHAAARGGLRHRGGGGAEARGTGRKVWIVPMGLCYRFLAGHDPLPELRSLMDRLETRFTWRVQSQRPLVDRILRYADGILSLKEVEYLGSPQPGSFKERPANLIEQILAAIESRRLKERAGDDSRTGQGRCAEPASRCSKKPATARDSTAACRQAQMISRTSSW